MSRLQQKISSRDLARQLRFRARELDASTKLPSRDFTRQLRIARRELHLNSRLLTSSSPLVRLYGHPFAALTPVITVLPVATPGKTTCNIAWETNVPAYHRVRYKESGDPAWTETEWTLATSTSASIDLSGLEPDSTLHIVDVQSSTVRDESGAFEYYPGDNSLTFRTLCSSAVLTVSNPGASKEGRAPLEYLELAWDTDYPVSDKEVRLKVGYGGQWHYYGPTAASGTSHATQVLGFDFAVGPYYWNVRNKNACGVQTNWQHADFGFYCDAGGNIAVEW